MFQVKFKNVFREYATVKPHNWNVKVWNLIKRNTAFKGDKICVLSCKLLHTGVRLHCDVINTLLTLQQFYCDVIIFGLGCSIVSNIEAVRCENGVYEFYRYLKHLLTDFNAKGVDLLFKGVRNFVCDRHFIIILLIMAPDG